MSDIMAKGNPEIFPKIYIQIYRGNICFWIDYQISVFFCWLPTWFIFGIPNPHVLVSVPENHGDHCDPGNTIPSKLSYSDHCKHHRNQDQLLPGFGTGFYNTINSKFPVQGNFKHTQFNKSIATDETQT